MAKLRDGRELLALFDTAMDWSLLVAYDDEQDCIDFEIHVFGQDFSASIGAERFAEHLVSTRRKAVAPDFFTEEQE